ncbi:MAG: hypothetical protein PUB21_09205 [Bacteroidales bacterium]|nr:hypothetical protein [Bacteroidales bacterium]
MKLKFDTLKNASGKWSSFPRLFCLQHYVSVVKIKVGIRYSDGRIAAVLSSGNQLFHTVAFRCCLSGNFISEKKIKNNNKIFC